MLRKLTVLCIILVAPSASIHGQNPNSGGVSQQGPQSAYVQRMMSLDRDADGFLAAKELPGKLGELLKAHDSDNDGRLSRLELRQVEQTAKGARDSQPAGKSRPDGGRRRRGGAGGSPLDTEQILRFALTFDRDGDGGLNAEELQRYAKALAARRAQHRQEDQTTDEEPKRETPASPPAGLGANDDPGANPFGAPPAPKP